MASLNDVKTCIESVNTANIDEFIKTLKTLLKTQRRGKRPSQWTSFIESGDKILCYVDGKAADFGEGVDLSKSGSQVLGVVSGILEAVGKFHWALTGLSMIGYLLTKADQISQNREECLNLLPHMLDLAEHINDMRDLLAEEKVQEKLEKALATVVKGSMLCAKQLFEGKLFRFLKSSLDDRNLKSVREEIILLYGDLNMTFQIAKDKRERQRQAEADYGSRAASFARHKILPYLQTRALPALVDYGSFARHKILPYLQTRALSALVDYGSFRTVPEQEVAKMLEMSRQDKEFRAVVIHGIDGIGKTYLAESVYSKLNLNGYTYCKIYMDSDHQKNKIKKKQEQILKDAFPNYNSGRAVDLKDKEGKGELRKAFQEASKPVFLFIDNVLRAAELKELLPDDLERLGKDIRILLTARDMRATNMFKKSCCHEYLVKPLLCSDARNFFCKGTKNLIDNKDVESILEICNGIPLALKIVGAELEKYKYNEGKCGEILNALRTGKEIKMDGLGEALVDFVFRKFKESAKEAFLDICCFFDGINRALVESSVGAKALKALQDAALITIKREPDPMQENEEIVVVHDVIKARGQNMAQYTRIRDIQSFQRAIKKKRLKKIKGIELQCDEAHSSYVLQSDHLNSMSESLRVLMLGPNISVSNESEMRFPELKYVHLDHNIPFVQFNSTNLPKLTVYIGPLPKGGVSIYKLPQSLIQISTFQSDGRCRDWDESMLNDQVAPKSSLQGLSLTSFSMKKLPKGLNDFKALRTLRLNNWYEMYKLPEVISGLHWLSTLGLVQCRFRHLPESFGDLKGLTHLSLKCCHRLEKLPSTMGKLKALRYLSLKECTSLKKLPSTFGELEALEGLNLEECLHLKEIPGLEKMRGLRYMNIQGCPELRRRD